MPDSNETTIHLSTRPVQCPHCGNYCHPDAAICEKCGGTLLLELTKQPSSTMPIERIPRAISTTPHGQVEFPDGYQVVLQVLPSGVCLQSALAAPVILGRAGSSVPTEDLLDLQSFNASQHGISRRHCMLARQNSRLIVTDLDSTNGTYLNNKRLKPQESYFAAHGDRLILGTLNLIIFFSAIQV